MKSWEGFYKTKIKIYSLNAFYGIFLSLSLFFSSRVLSEISDRNVNKINLYINLTLLIIFTIMAPITLFSLRNVVNKFEVEWTIKKRMEFLKKFHSYENYQENFNYLKRYFKINFSIMIALADIWKHFVSLISILIIGITINWISTLITLGFIILILIIGMFIFPITRPISLKIRKLEFNYLKEIAESQKSLDAYHNLKSEGAFKKMFLTQMDDFYKERLKLNTRFTLWNSIIIFLEIFLGVANILIISFLLKFNLSSVAIVVYLGFVSNAIMENLQLFNVGLFNLHYNKKHKKKIYLKSYKRIKQKVATLEFDNYNIDIKGKRIIRRDINASFVKGTKYIILGDNGSGKSSLFKYIYNDKYKKRGRILVNKKQIRNNVFYDDISYISGEYINNTEIVKTIFHKKSLSNGELAFLIIKRALLSKANFIVLDEMISKIGVKKRKEILGLIDKSKKCVIIIDHNIKRGAYEKIII